MVSRWPGAKLNAKTQGGEPWRNIGTCWPFLPQLHLGSPIFQLFLRVCMCAHACVCAQVRVWGGVCAGMFARVCVCTCVGDWAHMQTCVFVGACHFVSINHRCIDYFLNIQ